MKLQNLLNKSLENFVIGKFKLIEVVNLLIHM